MTERRGRTRILGAEERERCAAFIRDLLHGSHRDPHGNKWTLRTLGTELGVSQEAVRKAQDPERLGPAVARGLRTAFGTEVSLVEDSPGLMLAKLIARLKTMGVPAPSGVALHMALEGDLKDGLSESWRTRLKTVVEALIEDGLEPPVAHAALADSLQDVNGLVDALALYRGAMRQALPKKPGRSANNR